MFVHGGSCGWVFVIHDQAKCEQRKKKVKGDKTGRGDEIGVGEPTKNETLILKKILQCNEIQVAKNYWYTLYIRLHASSS